MIKSQQVRLLNMCRAASPRIEIASARTRQNPPTPAFTKAETAPGTTAGVEPVFVGLPLPCRSPAPTITCSAAASTRHSCHCPLLLRAFKPAVCQPSGHCPLLLRCRLPALKPLKPLKCSAAMPLPSVVEGVQACRLPAVRPLPSVVKGVQACRLPALKPLKPLKCSAAALTRYSCHRPLFASCQATALCC